MGDKLMNMSETKVIYDFTQKTRQGKMNWSKINDYDSRAFSNTRIVEAYRVDHNEEALELLVEVRVDDEFDTNVHRTVTHLYILDESGGHLWRFPDNDAIGDLLSAVQFQTGKVAGRLKNLMKD
jgi:hypothetical protein